MYDFAPGNGQDLRARAGRTSFRADAEPPALSPSRRPCAPASDDPSGDSTWPTATRSFARSPQPQLSRHPSGSQSARRQRRTRRHELVATLNANQQLAHDIYKQLIEINSTTDADPGGTTQAAEAMAARLRAAGFPGSDVQVFSAGPRDGNLVARLHGSGASGRKPILSARAPRRRRRASRRLEHRSVHVHGEGRLLLRARHERRQGDGRDLDREHDPDEAGGLRS